MWRIGRIGICMKTIQFASSFNSSVIVPIGSIYTQNNSNPSAVAENITTILCDSTRKKSSVWAADSNSCRELLLYFYRLNVDCCCFTCESAHDHLSRAYLAHWDHQVQRSSSDGVELCEKNFWWRYIINILVNSALYSLKRCTIDLFIYSLYFTLKFLFMRFTWKPSYVQLPNFMTHVCSSNGKYSTSISHELL